VVEPVEGLVGGVYGTGLVDPLSVDATVVEFDGVVVLGAEDVALDAGIVVLDAGVVVLDAGAVLTVVPAVTPVERSITPTLGDTSEPAGLAAAALEALVP
jgi:hypothetical protein